jgi:Retroviral aspartyl protease
MPTYLTGQIQGQRTVFLIDTGCETCILPERYAPKIYQRTTNSKLLAANGTTVEILGYATVTFLINQDLYSANFMITSDVGDIILGQTFLSQHNLIWNVATSTVTLDHKTYALVCRGSAIHCRHIALADNAIIQPRRRISPVKTLTGHLPPNLLESRQLETGLYTARTLLPANQPNLLLTVSNVRDVPLHLKRGERLGVTEEVTVETPQLNQEATLNRQQQVEHLVNQTVANLPQEFTDAERHEFCSILLRNEACFSLN